MSLLIGLDGVLVYLQGKRRHWLVGAHVPELVTEGGKHERCTFTGDAGKGQHDAGDDASAGGSQHHRKNGTPFGNAEAKGSFADGLWHQQEHLFGGARDYGDHHDAERYAAGKKGKMS